MPPVAERASLCLLEREGADRLEPIAAEAALAELLRAPEPGFDAFAEHTGAVLAPLATRAFRLRMGDDPRTVLPLLDAALAHA